MKAPFWNFLEILRGNGEVATRVAFTGNILVTPWSVATVNFAFYQLSYLRKIACLILSAKINGISFHLHVADLRSEKDNQWYFHENKY